MCCLYSHVDRDPEYSTCPATLDSSARQRVRSGRLNARSDSRQLPTRVPAMLNPMNRLEGNVALITGGSRGIGAAVALRLAEEGADLVLTYENNAERAGEVVEQIKARGRRALAVQADSAVPEALTAAVDEAAATFG